MQQSCLWSALLTYKGLVPEQPLLEVLELAGERVMELNSMFIRISGKKDFFKMFCFLHR